MSNHLTAKTCRLLCLQSCQHARNAGFLWAALEGIRHVGLEIPDFGSLRTVYGDCHCRRLMNHPGLKISLRQLTLFLTDLLGSFIIYCDHINYDSTSPSSSAPSSGVPGPALRRHSVLCDQYVRSLSQGAYVLSARSLLFLVLLLFHEFYMDCHPRQYV